MLPTDRPTLPSWMPVLVRHTGEIQVGLDADAGLLIAGAPPGLDAVLGLLDGAHTVVDLTAEAADRGVGGDQLLTLLRNLHDAGLLQPTRPSSALPARLAQVRLIGAGPLGQAIAYALLDAGVGDILVVDSDPVDPARYPKAGVATSQAQALAQELNHLHASVRVAEHWVEPELPAPELTVVAADRLEPDRAIGVDYVREDHPHLYLRPLLGGAIVGPYVRPGHTPCLGCLDLVRADADPQWPSLLPQLCRARVPVDPLLARWAAATAVTQLIAELGTGPGLLAGTTEMTALECEMRYRPWPVHPSCGCAW